VLAGAILIAVEAGGCRHVGESALAVVAPQDVPLAAVGADQHVLVAVVVPVGVGDAVGGAVVGAGALAPGGEQAGLLGDVLELALAVTEEEAVGVGGDRLPVGAVPGAGEDVEAAVVVRVE
jgi:hypothetical protein